MSLSKNDEELLEAFNSYPENIEDNNWREVIGEKEYWRMKKEALKFAQKQTDKHIENLLAKYEATKDKRYIHGLQALGYPVAD